MAYAFRGAVNDSQRRDRLTSGPCSIRRPQIECTKASKASSCAICREAREWSSAMRQPPDPLLGRVRDSDRDPAAELSETTCSCSTVRSTPSTVAQGLVVTARHMLTCGRICSRAFGETAGGPQGCFSELAQDRHAMERRRPWDDLALQIG